MNDTPGLRTIADAVREHARGAPRATACVCPAGRMDYAGLDTLMDRIAHSLQRDGLGPGDVIAVCATMSATCIAVCLGAVRAGVAIAPLPLSAAPAQLAAMAEDAAARWLFTDAAHAALMRNAGLTDLCIALDDSATGTPLAHWLAPPGSTPAPVRVAPESPFSILYSSGTTGTPKGIVQSHGRRAGQLERLKSYGFGPQAVTLLATPLYSNTTLFCLLPTLAGGGAVVLMPRFDARGYLALAQAHRATHTVLVPVQYQRILAVPDFAAFDLGAFRMKFCAGAPFSAADKAEVLRRWPGGLVELYGTTEGGGSCLLVAHEHPDKLHTVGRPTADCVLRIIDDAGRELPAGCAGEIVGHAPGMMDGYHRRPEATREAEWFDAQGRRFLRTGDVGYFDEDGFLVLVDRKKDMIISGGFNIYPSDLEAVLATHPAVAEAAVIGVPSERWVETPVAFAVLRPHAASSGEDILAWTNERVGRTQRLSALYLVDELPRNAVGKVLKRELRALHLGSLNA